MNGLAGACRFIEMLEDRDIPFRLEQQRADTIMIRFRLPGTRAEVEFFDDHFEYSYFKGDEQGVSDRDALLALIAEHWD